MLEGKLYILWSAFSNRKRRFEVTASLLMLDLQMNSVAKGVSALQAGVVRPRKAT
jgi:hypothetical protein